MLICMHCAGQGENGSRKNTQKILSGTEASMTVFLSVSKPGTSNCLIRRYSPTVGSLQNMGGGNRCKRAVVTRRRVPLMCNALSWQKVTNIHISDLLSNTSKNRLNLLRVFCIF